MQRAFEQSDSIIIKNTQEDDLEFVYYTEHEPDNAQYVGQWTKEQHMNALYQEDIQHSDKGSYTDNPLVELLKDVDSVDRYLHGVKTEGAYEERCKRALEELGIMEQF